jgi:hypothetical protein
VDMKMFRFKWRPARQSMRMLICSTPAPSEARMMTQVHFRKCPCLPRWCICPVTLPRFSQAGRYEIRVSKDKAGTQLVAQGSGDAVENAGNTEVKVVLDLRAAKAGMYFLATVRDADNGATTTP